MKEQGALYPLKGVFPFTGYLHPPSPLLVTVEAHSGVKAFLRVKWHPGEGEPAPTPWGSEYSLGRMVLYRFFRTSPGMLYSFGSTKFMGISCRRRMWGCEERWVDLSACIHSTNTDY